MSAPTLRRAAIACAAGALMAFATLAVQSADSTYEKDRREGEARCRADWFSSTYMDCTCMGEAIAKDVASRGEANSGTRDYSMTKLCPQKDTTILEADAFKRCESIQRNLRTDHEQYCHCVGENFAKQYVANGSSERRIIEMLTRNALVACGVDNGSRAIKPSREGPEWTPAGLEKQRADQEASCLRNSEAVAFGDCACAARKMVELATAPGESRPVTSFVQQAFDACPQPDRAVVAKRVFDSCDSYMVSVRTDHDSFCKCTADGFVERYYEKPQLNLRHLEKLRREAMQACGLGDQSKRIVTTTPVKPAEATSGCVKFYSNEKRILENAEQNKRFHTESRTAPDVVLVNECSNIIRLITTVEYAAPRKDAVPECAFKRIYPGENVPVRSQSRVVRSGLESRIPATPLFLCLGDTVTTGANSYKSECSCSAGFPRVDIPLGETLKPLP